jgi:general secretion pathway protein F
MSFFEYKAITVQGKNKSGLIEAENLKTAVRLLKTQSLAVLDINESKNKLKIKTSFNFQKKLNVAQIAFLTRQLASLIEASMPIDEALQTIIRHSDKKTLSRVTREIHSAVIEGKSLAESFNSSANFPAYYIATIEAGELSGNLSFVLGKLAQDLEQQHKFKKKVSSALIYPMMISIVAVVVIVALLVMVVPQIVSVFDDMKQTLPPLTIAVIGLSNFLSQYYLLLLLMIILFILGFNLALKKEKIQKKWHQFLAKIPLFGHILVMSNAIRFARTFSLLHASQTPIILAMQNAAEVLSLLPMKQAILKASDRVREGSSIFKALETNKALPPMILYMLASGEASGNLSVMLDKAVTNQEFELDTYISKILNLFEPLMILVMGGVVLLIVLAILMPIFEINQIPL